MIAIAVTACVLAILTRFEPIWYLVLLLFSPLALPLIVKQSRWRVMFQGIYAALGLVWLAALAWVWLAGHGPYVYVELFTAVVLLTAWTIVTSSVGCLVSVMVRHVSLSVARLMRLRSSL
jgi:hypothetical protein